MDKIFVQIASYRDPQLILTIADMLERAKNPEALTFGICWQYDEEEDTTIFDDKPNFRIKKFHYSESEGLGWARNVTNSLYDGEKYTLQIDSHHRFVDNWDEIVLEDYNQALQVSEKPVITTYCTPFDPEECRCKYNQLPSLMSQYEFSYDKLLMSMPWYIQDYQQRTKVIRARTISGHFYFTSGNFIKEVPYDPDIYFGGYTEETTLSVRAFTNGYDMFSPYRMVMWHEYTRNYRVKHWDDHGVNSPTKKTSGERDIYARNKTRQLFGQEDHGIDMGMYGLGTVRTLHDYEVFGGFDFKNCRIQEYTLKVNEPPNPIDWEDQFKTNRYDLTIDWDIEFFKKHSFDNPKFMTLGVQTSSGVELHRRDFTMEKDPEYVKLDKNIYNVTIETRDRPAKLVMYLFDQEKQWSERYEKNIHV
jgi:glycosyltransferase involved in cell wall biosynthesis